MKLYTFHQAFKQTTFHTDPEHVTLEEKAGDSSESLHAQNDGVSEFWLLVIQLTKGAPFQFISSFVVVLSLLASHPISDGLAFLEKEPPVLECLGPDGQWQICTKEAVCGGNLTAEEWRPDASQYEYLDNWVEKFDLLCKPEQPFGFFAGSYFFGAISTIIVMPALADTHGRRPILLAALCASVVAQALLMLTHDFKSAAILVFILGATFPGRTIVGLCYMMEFCPDRAARESIASMYVYGLSYLAILSALFFQFVSKHTLTLQAVFLAISVLTALFVLVYMPESPEWLCKAGHFKASKQALVKVASFNGVKYDSHTGLTVDRFRYTDEVLLEANSDNEDQPLLQGGNQPRQVEPEVSEIDENTYYSNLVKMAVMWTSILFMSQMMTVVNKHLEGSTFVC